MQRRLRSSGLPRTLLAEEAALRMLALLADIERGDGTVIAHHARPYFARLALVVRERERFVQAFDFADRFHKGLLGNVIFVTRRASVAFRQASRRRTWGRTGARRRDSHASGRSRTSGSP